VTSSRRTTRDASDRPAARSSPEPLRRDHSWIEREYGAEKWPAVERLIEQQIAAEPRPDLGRVLRRVAREQWRTADPLAGRRAVIDGREVQLPRSATFAAQQGLIVDVLLDACSPRTGLVVELGAGWAWHLLSLWSGGGPGTATYVAAEYTAAGRRAAARLAALDARLRFRAVEFDYREPDLRTLGRVQEAVVFTQHSVEQVDGLPDSLFTTIRGLADRVTCVHFEPVGWQCEAGGRAGSSRAYAERHAYNRDLVQRLRAEQAAGRLTIRTIATEVVGVNPDNATSVIVWTAST